MLNFQLNKCNRLRNPNFRYIFADNYFCAVIFSNINQLKQKTGLQNE